MLRLDLLKYSEVLLMSSNVEALLLVRFSGFSEKELTRAYFFDFLKRSAVVLFKQKLPTWK